MRDTTGGPRARRAVPSRATERRRAGGACLPTGAKPGWRSAAVFEQPASNRVMVLSAVCPIWASRNLASGRPAPLCPVRDQRGEACRNEERGVAVPRPSGTRCRLGSTDFGKLLPWHGPQAAVGGIAVQRYSL